MNGAAVARQQEVLQRLGSRGLPKDDRLREAVHEHELGVDVDGSLLNVHG